MLQNRTYQVITFGCQMNKSDSERVCGMLDALGARPFVTSQPPQAKSLAVIGEKHRHSVADKSSTLASSGFVTDLGFTQLTQTGMNGVCEEKNHPDIIIFLTCCVRQAADTRLLGQVAALKDSSALIAVGGCIGQRDGAKLREQLPHIDVVFGTHNIADLPNLLSAALYDGGPHIGLLSDSSATSIAATADLPARRERPWQAWLPIMSGCNNHCSYCVVPQVRGRERSLPSERLKADVANLVRQGVLEISLLGQNVNSYGRDLYGQPRFAQLLRQLSALGVSRLRFFTSHPKDLSAETIAAFAQESTVMPALHLPAQSGSDRILKAMNRNYSAAHYLELVAALRQQVAAAGKPQVALSTDIIVGFPGEGERDFEQTMRLLEQVGFAQVFTFIYSPRAGTPAANLCDDTPRQVIQKRFQRLVDKVQQDAWAFNQSYLGTTLPVLFEGPSKRDTSMLSGKSPANQTVHAPLPAGRSAADYAGRVIDVHIEVAKTWYLRGRLLAND